MLPETASSVTVVVSFSVTIREDTVSSTVTEATSRSSGSTSETSCSPSGSEKRQRVTPSLQRKGISACCCAAERPSTRPSIRTNCPSRVSLTQSGRQARLQLQLLAHGPQREGRRHVGRLDAADGRGLPPDRELKHALRQELKRPAQLLVRQGELPLAQDRPAQRQFARGDDLPQVGEQALLRRAEALPLRLHRQALAKGDLLARGVRLDKGGKVLHHVHAPLAHAQGEQPRRRAGDGDLHRRQEL